MELIDKIEDWKKSVAYFRRKYGKNSIEAKSAKLNLEIARKAYRDMADEQANDDTGDYKTFGDWVTETDPSRFWDR